MMKGNLCRFLIEVVGGVDTGLFGVEHGGDAAMGLLELYDEVQLFWV